VPTHIPICPPKLGLWGPVLLGYFALLHSQGAAPGRVALQLPLPPSLGLSGDPATTPTRACREVTKAGGSLPRQAVTLDQCIFSSGDTITPGVWVSGGVLWQCSQKPEVICGSKGTHSQDAFHLGHMSQILSSEAGTEQGSGSETVDPGPAASASRTPGRTHGPPRDSSTQGSKEQTVWRAMRASLEACEKARI
jgi:hypothetical protein